MKKIPLMENNGKGMKKLIIICVVAIGLMLGLGVSARAATVNVILTPKKISLTGTVVDVGETFELELWLRSSDESTIVMDDAHLLLEWDPAYVGFSGSASTVNGDYDWTTTMSGPTNDIPMYAWEGSAGENASYADGDAKINLYPCFASMYGMSLPQTDLNALTLTFTALALTDSTLINIRPMTYAECGVNSGIIKPDGYPVGGIGMGADVSVVPEPGTMMLFLFGITGLFGAAGIKKRFLRA